MKDPALVTVLIVMAIIVGAAVVILILELQRLANKTPGDHITAAFRKFTQEHSGLMVLLASTASWIFGVICGHIWAAW